MGKTPVSRILFVLIAILASLSVAFGKPAKKVAAKPKPNWTVTSRAYGTKAKSRVGTRLAVNSFRAGSTRSAVRVSQSPWKSPTFVEDSAEGDRIEGEDPVVRQAAADALGNFNGTIVVADPFSGRILSIVNQKLAFKSGFIPCSTVKIVTAYAALSEGIIDKNTQLRLSRYQSMNLTSALAKSNNPYFAMLGEKLGFDRIIYYSRLLGLGETAGLDIEGERAGILPSVVPTEGIGMMTSFGSGISQTPLELTSLLSAIANGGTLYYLQHPRNASDVARFQPRVKRKLEMDQWIPELKPGLMGAVEYGTARRAGYATTEQIFGKTGTCTDDRSPTHMGWFGAFSDSGRNSLVVVVMLTGGRPVNGPVASGVAGAVYRNLAKANYSSEATSAKLVSTACCRK